VVGVTYDANPMQISKFCADMIAYLHKDTSIDQTRISVNLDGYGDSSINIIVVFHYKIELGESEGLRNQTYLEAIRTIVINQRMDFAFPTRTLIIQNQNNGPAPISSI